MPLITPSPSVSPGTTQRPKRFTAAGMVPSGTSVPSMDVSHRPSKVVKRVSISVRPTLMRRGTSATSYDSVMATSGRSVPKNTLEAGRPSAPSTISSAYQSVTSAKYAVCPQATWPFVPTPISGRPAMVAPISRIPASPSIAAKNSVSRPNCQKRGGELSWRCPSLASSE